MAGTAEADDEDGQTQSSAMRSPRKSGPIDVPTQAAHILLNGVDPMVVDTADEEDLESVNTAEPTRSESMDQSAEFFDPNNTEATKLRDHVAMSTLNELLKFLLKDGGSVGILDATNSTIKRRQAIFDHIKKREQKVGILFIESVCEDKKVSFYVNIRSTG